AHRVLADAVMDVAAVTVLCREGTQTALVLRGALQVRRAGQQLRDGIGQQIQDVAGGLDTGLREPLLAGAAPERAQRRLPALRQAALAQAVERAAFVRRQRRHPRLPGFVVRQAAAPGLAPG